MAKIYETREDLARDRLKEAVRVNYDGKQTALSGILSGLSFGIFGFAFEAMDKWRDKATNTVRTGFISKHLNYVMAYTGLLSAAFSTYSFFSRRSDMKKAAIQLEALGPEQVVLPPDSAITLPCGCTGSCCCKAKKFAGKRARTPVELAAQNSVNTDINR
jgi:hypothetical protein